MTESTPRPMTRRRSFLLLAVWAGGGGIVCLGLGWLVWQPLYDLGWLGVILGVAWIACVPFTSVDPITPAYRRYLQAFLPAMGGYVIAIFVLGSIHALALPTWARVVVGLLPVAPMAWVVVSMWRFARASDELERRIQLEAVFITCGVVGVLAFAGGMLQMVHVIRIDAGLFYVLPAMFLVYGMAGWWCRRRYGLTGVC